MPPALHSSFFMKYFICKDGFHLLKLILLIINLQRKKTLLGPLEASQTYFLPFVTSVSVDPFTCSCHSILSVCHPTQGGRLRQSGTGGEWLHRGQGLHPAVPALPCVWHSAWVSGHWLQVLLNAQVSLSSLVQPGTSWLCRRKSLVPWV